MKFIHFQEMNEHEGETWNFWLQVDGNDDELDRLVVLLERAGVDEELVLLDDEITEDQVDTLVEYGGSGYMNYHHKIKGLFTCPRPDLEDEHNMWSFVSRTLYKGGIKKYFDRIN